MATYRISSCVWVVLFTVVTVRASAAEPHAGQIQWANNLESARRAAVESGRPILLVFGASWSHFHRQFQREVLSDAQVVRDVNDHFVPLQMDVDKDRTVAGVFDVTAAPSVVVLSPHADLLGKVQRYLDGPQLRQVLARTRLLNEKVAQARAADRF